MVAPASHRLSLRKQLRFLVVLGITFTGSAAWATPSPQAVGFSSHEGNIVVTHDRYLGHVEPDVAVNPRNPKNLIGACQFELGPRLRLPGTFVTFDGGRSWHDNGLLPLPAGFEQGADTTVGFAANGEGYVVALMSHGGGGFASRVVRGGIFLWRTHDGGRSYTKPEPVYVGHGFQDHPWLGLRRSRRSTSLFVAWTNDAGLEFAVSNNDGASFSKPQLLVAGIAPSNPVLTVGPRSTLHVFFQEFVGPTIQKIHLAVVTSTDDGLRFGAVQRIATVAAAPLAGSGPKGGAVPPPLLGAATDPISGQSAVAISAQDARLGHPVVEIWEKASTSDRWRGPFRPATGAMAALSQQQPRLLFVRGHLYVSFFTTTRQGKTEEQLAHAAPGATHFVTRALSDTPFRADGFIGDYQALASAGSDGYGLWNDARSGRVEIVAGRLKIK